MKTILILLTLLIVMSIYIPLAVIAITFGQVFRLLDGILKQIDKRIIQKLEL